MASGVTSSRWMGHVSVWIRHRGKSVALFGTQDLQRAVVPPFHVDHRVRQHFFLFELLFLAYYALICSVCLLLEPWLIFILHSDSGFLATDAFPISWSLLMLILESLYLHSFQSCGYNLMGKSGVLSWLECDFTVSHCCHLWVAIFLAIKSMFMFLVVTGLYEVHLV